MPPVGTPAIALSTYCFVAACRAAVGFPLSINAPDIVSPVLDTLPFAAATAAFAVDDAVFAVVRAVFAVVWAAVSPVSTYCLVAAPRAAVGFALSINAPVIVSPAFATLNATWASTYAVVAPPAVPLPIAESTYCLVAASVANTGAANDCILLLPMLMVPDIVPPAFAKKLFVKLVPIVVFRLLTCAST